jgi:teichuronic acid biosynthesis glycosyltransferase TuaC
VKVLVLSSTFPSVEEPTRGVFIFERIRRLAAHCDVIVVAPVPWVPLNRWFRGGRARVPRVERQGGLTVYHPRFVSLPRYGKFLDGALYAVSLLPFIARVRRVFPFDLIDAHFEFPDGVGAVLLGRWWRRPVLVTLRGKIVRLAGYRTHRPQLAWMLRRATRVLAVSDYLRRQAAGLGLPPERVRVIRNGVDTSVFAPMDREAARVRCGLPAGRVLLTVAALYAHKGQHTVIDALPALVHRHPGLLYVMIGSGRPGESYARDLERQAARLGVAQSVRFVGPRPHRELAPWFASADLFVLPTRSEGWPNVLLEALACGVPVVATRVGGVPEIVRHGTDGLLVPYGDGPAFEAAVLDALTRDWDRDQLVGYARSLGWSEVVREVLDEMSAAAPAAAPMSAGAFTPDR